MRAYAFVKTKTLDEKTIIKELEKIPEVNMVDSVYGDWNIIATLEGPEQQIGSAHLKIMNLPIMDSQVYLALSD